MADLDSQYYKKAKYRNFHSDVEKELSSFDKVKEWADLVQCLKRIDIVLDRYSQFPIIPVKLTFCKRMAQCLNPSLPSGVHVQTLKTCAKVFDRMGSERLARDFGLFVMGILPLFQHAATQVKPVILRIYEVHFIPLGPALTPALSGLIMSILPALEEESGEFYERCLKLLDQMCKATSTEMFYRALWKAILLSESTRLPAISYLTQRLPAHKEQMTKETVAQYLPEAEVLVKSSLRAGLQDAQLLTQRSAMELMITHFNLDGGLFSINGWIELAASSLLLVTRREVSLNRRLYAWMSGPEGQEGWFKEHGKPVAIGAVKKLFLESEDPTYARGAATLPLRVLMSLLDKPEIGAEIIDPLLVEVFRRLHQCSVEGYSFAREVKHTVHQLFDMLEPSTIWSVMAVLFVSEPVPVEAIVLIGEVIDLLPLGDVQTQSVHLPDMLCGLSSGLIGLAEIGEFGVLHAALQLALKVYGKMAPFNSSSKNFDTEGIALAVTAFEEFYVEFMDTYILPRTWSDDTETVLLEEVVGVTSKILTNLESHLKEREAGSSGHDWYRVMLNGVGHPSPAVSTISASAYAKLLARAPHFGISEQFKGEILSERVDTRMVVERLWAMLHHSLTSLHFQIAKVFLDLYDVAKDVITAVIGEALLAEEIDVRVDGCNRFALLWRLVGEITTKRVFSGNLLLMLDSLSDQEPVVRLAGRTWLSASISKVERILDPLLLVLLDPSTARQRNMYRTTYDARRVLYVLRIMKAVIESNFRFIQNAQSKTISKDVLSLNQQQVIDDASVKVLSDDDIDLRESTDGEDDGLHLKNYVGLLALTAMRFILGRVQGDADPEFQSQNRVVQTTSAEFLRYMLARMTDTAQMHAAAIARAIQPHVLRALGKAVAVRDFVLQVELLRLLQTVVMLHSFLGSRGSGAASSTSSGPVPSTSPPQSALLSHWESICASPLFLETIVCGIQQPSQANVRYYWLEFITATMPYIQDSLASFVSPLCSCMCEIIVTCENAHDSASVSNVVLVLRALHVILSYGLSKEPEPEPTSSGREKKDESNPALALITMPIIPLQMLTGLVKDVFVDDRSQVAAPQLTPSAEAQGEASVVCSISNDSQARAEIFKILPLILRATVKVWQGGSTSESTQDEVHNKYIVQDLVTRTLDPIFANYPDELLFSICCLWEQDKHTSQGALQDTVLQILSTFDSISHEVVFRSLRSIVGTVLRSRNRIQRGSTGSGDTVASVPIHETSTLDFLNRYLAAQPGSNAELLSKGWPDFLLLVKQQMASRTPATFLLLLRTFDLYVEKVSTSLLHDKSRLRELQESATKVVELCVKISSDISSTLAAGNRDEESVHRMRSLSLKALNLVGTTVPKLYDSIFQDDKERFNGAINNVMPTLISFLKDHRPHPSVLAGACASLQFFTRLLQYPFTFRVWRKDISDLFYSSDFFQCDFAAIKEWRQLINHIMTVDKGFSELKKVLSKSLLTHQASMMFVSKEQEDRMRARNIKRLSFVLYSGEVDKYNTQLSWIQEKLVDALKLSDAYPVYVEVFHCLRVLLLRISPKRLASFWPVIFAELMRFLGFAQPPTYAPLVLSACKFVDVALLVPAEEFKLCEWLFVHDAPSVLQANLPLFVPFISRLCQTVRKSEQNLLNLPNGKKRRPMILERSVETMDSLLPYLSNFATLAYDSTVAGGKIDMDFLERVVEADMIEFKHIDKFENSPVRLLTEEADVDGQAVAIRKEPRVASNSAGIDAAE